jgi:hypothetical protein
MITQKAQVLFAPDGEHFQVIKKGETGRMWDYFNFNHDIRVQIALNPQAKFRLIGESGIVIGELPRFKFTGVELPNGGR